MKLITFLLIVTLLLAGCVTKRDRLTPSFYEAKRTDTVWVDYHSIELDGTRTLIVNLKDTADNLDIAIGEPTTYSTEGTNTRIGYSYYRWQENISDRFFNEIVNIRTLESLKRMTAVTAAESEKETISTKDIEEMGRQADAELIIVLRNISFSYDYKYDYSLHTDTPYLSFSGFWKPSHTGISANSAMVYYRSVWDLYWLDKGHVTNQRTIVQKSAYWMGFDDKGPLESVLSCALKVSDDFISLFKQKENKKRE